MVCLDAEEFLGSLAPLEYGKSSGMVPTMDRVSEVSSGEHFCYDMGDVRCSFVNFYSLVSFNLHYFFDRFFFAA